MSDTPQRWEPPQWMLPHLEALGLTQRARQLMNGPRADVRTNAPLAMEQAVTAAQVQMLHTLHGTRRLLPNLHDYEGYTVVEITHIGGDVPHAPEELIAMARAGLPYQTVIFHGVTTIGPVYVEGADRDGC